MERPKHMFTVTERPKNGWSISKIPSETMKTVRISGEYKENTAGGSAELFIEGSDGQQKKTLLKEAAAQAAFF